MEDCTIMEELTNRKKQAISTKKRILDTSMKLMKEYGYDAMTIKQICDEAGVSTGAFYHHLGSKDGIIIEGYSECDRYFEKYVINNLKSDNIIDRIIEYIGYQMKYAVEIGIDTITQIYKAQLTNANEFFLSDKRALSSNLLILIKEAQNENLLRDDFTAEEIRDELLLISRGTIYNWSQKNGSFDLIGYCNKLISHHIFFYVI